MEQNKSNTDNELMLQIVGYNSEAFQQLFNRYSPSLLGIIKEIISNPKLAESVLFNVFSVFLKRLDYFNTTTNNVYTYLTLLTRNVAIDVLKRMKFVEDIPIYSDEYEIEFILPGLSKEITTIDLDLRYVLGEQMKNYRSQLTEVQNLLLSLIYFEGLNEEEIAKRLNVPMVTVRQKILTIMDTLHQQYAGQNSANHNDKAILELIKLEAVGFLTSEERMMIENLKENDPDFLWKELGEYQNMTALISASIPEQVISRNSSEELMNIFTQILLQDGEVQYPIIPSEIPIAEQDTLKPVEKVKQTKTVVDDTINLVSVKQEDTVKVEQKESGFHLKFREPDPTELNILRKLDRTELKPKTAPVVNRIDKETLQKEVKPQVTKPDVVISRIANSPKPKEIINTELKSEQILNKVNTPAPQPVNDIENDDPLIIIEEPKPAVAKTEEKHVSRLTPTSSINIDDIIKKDINPVKRNTLVENSRLSNSVQTKQPLAEEPKQEVKPIPVETPKEIFENKSVVTQPPVQVKSDITFKVNQVPKEFKEDLRKAEKESAPIVNKVEQTPVEKFEIKIKSNEPPKEIKPSNTVAAKTQETIQVKQEKPVAPQSDIKIRSNEPPKELKRTTVVPEQSKKPVEIKSTTPPPQKPIEQPKPVQQPKEIAKPEVQQINEVKPIENKVVTPIVEQEKVNPKSEDTQKLNSLFKTRERKPAEQIKTESPVVNKSSLKIRETKFVEDDTKQSATNRKESNVDDIKSVVENIIKDKHLTGTITVDEVLAKLNKEKQNHQPEPELEPETVVASDDIYEAELQNIHKKRKVGILVTAALFLVVAVTAGFIYLKFQPDTIQAANDTKPNKPQTVVGQQVDNLTSNDQNIALNEKAELTDEKNTQPETKTEEIKEEEKTTTENHLKISPITNNLNKQDESYTTINTNNQNKENTQTAAAKTETTTPPKDNKTTEQEPSVFVAVEEMPELVGGLQQLQTKIKYPEIAKRTGVEGKVYVKAIVDENGNVISASTIKGIGAGCDEAAIDAVRNSKFTPGKQRGKNVKVQVTIPIVFKK